jgi:hypothetical protein
MTRRNDARLPAQRGRTRRTLPATPAAQPTLVNNVAVDEQDQPRFAQPEVTAAPTEFHIRHASDAAAYKTLDAMARAHELKPIPFPAARGGDEPILTMAQILGDHGPAAEKQVTAAGKLVFHSVGDTGNTHGPALQEEVADKLAHDFTDPPGDLPRFFFHLGDVIYSFGEARYYYDQFYDAYRNYPAPIVALAGNHDGMVAPNTEARSLDAFLRNFCAEHFEITPEAGGLDRTAQIQPGVYFTFEVPFVRILALYSNALEDPGVISTHGGQFPEVTDVQLTYLRTALTRVKSDAFQGAVIIAHHHPAYTIAGERGHGSSTDMRKEIDAICDEVGVWPHAVLSGHAHNYQRYTRARAAMQIPYVIAGGGGHSRPQKLTRRDDPPLRTPLKIATDTDAVVLENYDDTDTGYLRIVVTASQLRIEYHPSSDADMAKTPDDQVTIDLGTRQIVHFTG